MPHLEGSQTPHAAGGPRSGPAAPALVELRRKVCNRFYEPLVLLIAATQACMHNMAPKTLEPVPDRFSLTREELFHDFMNKMAQICDTRHGGDTVTAAVALQYPDRVQYRFASNQRTEAELEQVRCFVVDILHTLQGLTTEESSPAVKASILQKIVVFNRPRLRVYVKAVAAKSEECLRTTGLAAGVVEKLGELRDLSTLANNEELDEGAFFKNCSGLMKRVRKLWRSNVHQVFRDKANAAQAGEENPWQELRHAAGRLLSYFEAAQTLLEARAQPGWDRLFHEFEVVCVPSSRPLPNPITRRGDGAEQILNRMASTHPREADGLAALRRAAEDLQRFHLDELVRKESGSPRFRPIVHAEVLVHESVVADPDVGDAHSARFFGGHAYIGSSKPTCRLCHYYFRAVGDDVQVRRTHRNLYRNWRVPDVYAGQAPIQGEAADKRRENILNAVVVWIRQDAYRVLSDKVGERKAHDSNTSRTYQRGGVDTEYSSWGGAPIEEDADDTASLVGQLDLED